MKKNKYKEFFDELLIENDKKEKIYSNIVNKKYNKFNFKLAYVMPIFIFSLFNDSIIMHLIPFLLFYNQDNVFLLHPRKQHYDSYA